MLLAVLALAAGSHASRSRGTVAPFSLVINLGHRADRLAAFRAIYYSSDFAAVPLERLESVDGRAADWSMLLDGPALQRLATVQRTGVRASHEELTPGAIGCYLSHMEAWRRVASSGAPYAFVFEDDAVVDPHALAAFEAARQQAPPGWDILLLGCSGGRASAPSLNLTRVDDFLGLWAYAISADAARALHATMLPLSQQVDHEVTGRIKAGLLRIYAVQPFAAQHSWDQGTDIQLPTISPGPTVFVSIPSFRDRGCADTLVDLFAKADRPRNIYVGTCEQNLDPDEACVDERLGAHAARVRRMLLNASEAQGPTYARHLISKLYRGETFYLQLDSHTRFVDGWDTRLLRMHAALPDPDRACITGHPTGWGDEDKIHVPIMCISRFGDDGMVVLETGLFMPSSMPREVPFVAAGFLFAPGHAILECPLDPDLPELFHGEELLHSARLWTHGYRFWAPSENVLFHHYDRPGEAKYYDAREPAWYARQRATQAKVQLLLAGGLPDYQYGFGRAHTLQQYWDFARMDVVGRTSQTRETFCGDPPVAQICHKPPCFAGAHGTT